MQWNPTLDAGQLQREWLHRAYGPAAGAAMEQFYSKLSDWFGDYYRANAETDTLLTIDMLKKIYAAHYGEMEQLFLQAARQPMTDKQRQRLKLIENNLVVLQWRLRNAGCLPVDGVSPLRRSNANVAALLNTYHKDFPLFPGLVPGGTYLQPVPPQWKVNLSGTAESTTKNASGLSAGMFLLFPTSDGEIRITPRRVTHGAYFASYKLMDATGNPIETGLLEQTAPIVWTAKANTPYYLYIPPRKAVDYELDVENATAAQGELAAGTLTLSGKPSRTHVFHVPQDSAIGVYEVDNNVTIKKPYSGAVAKDVMGEAYTNTRTFVALDEGWKFSPDPKNDGLQRGVLKADFDDSTWSPISPLDWWQLQGFPNYHGVGWYRIKFTAPQLPATDRARLYFGAIDGNAVVYLNGEKITEHLLGEDFKGWDRPFSNDVTGKVREGENTLVVQVTSKSKDTASGIFKGAAIVAGTRR